MMKIKILVLPVILLVLLSSFERKRDKITIYTIGDSTMADKDTSQNNPERGWAQILPLFVDQKYLTVENHAVNGRSSKSFEDEGRWKKVSDKLKKGDYVFIEFGHNDEKIEDARRYTDPEGSYRTYLTRFVEESRAKGASPVLMTPIVRRKFDSNGILADTHERYPDAVRELAQQLKVPMIDMEAATRRLIQQEGPQKSKTMFMWLSPGQSGRHPKGLQDDTHLCEYGAFVVAGLAVEGMRELNLPVTRYFRKDVVNPYPEPAIIPDPFDPIDPEMKWPQVVEKQPDQWYASEQAVAIADQLLLYQRYTGGWPKNIPMHQKLDAAGKRAVLEDKEKNNDSTIDNGATYLEIIFLSKVYSRTRMTPYKNAVVKAVQYLLDAQYANGGWPQFFPLVKGYYSHITYNDHAMVNALTIMDKVASRDKQMIFVSDPDMVRRCAAAFERGVGCILKTQYRQDGKLTVWCAQHDEVTLEPAKARAYELPSLSGSESVGILELLMKIKDPSPEVQQAITGAIEWFRKTEIKGIRLDRFVNSDGQKDIRVVEDHSAPPLWGRFYNLDDNRPFFCDRDGVKKYNLSEIGYERRTGYKWYTDAPQRVINKYNQEKSL